MLFAFQLGFTYYRLSINGHHIVLFDGNGECLSCIWCLLIDPYNLVLFA